MNDGQTKLFTRNGNDGATYFPGFLSPPSWIDARQAIVDGEVVALDEDGAPDFGILQERISELRAGRRVGGLAYQAFDLLYLDGRSLLRVPLEDRKRLLRSVLREGSRVRFASHVETEGLAFHAAAEQRGIEGILAKLRRSTYEPGQRTRAWLKIKIRPEQELVVGGWTPGEGNAKDLGALIVGVYEDGKLRYAGKVGSGFNAKIRSDLRKRLEALAVDKPAFDPAPERKGELRSAHWIRPELVIRAELGGWTREGYVRQTAFKGLEIAKDPRDVARERPMATSKAVQEAETMTRKSGSAEPPDPPSAPTATTDRYRAATGLRSSPNSTGLARRACGRSMGPSSSSPTSTRSCSGRGRGPMTRP